MNCKCKVFFYKPSSTCRTYRRPYQFFRDYLVEDIFESDARSVGDFWKNVVTRNMALAVGLNCPVELIDRSSEYFGDEKNFKFVLIFKSERLFLSPRTFFITCDNFSTQFLHWFVFKLNLKYLNKKNRFFSLKI